MKKYILFAIILFCLGLTNVLATNDSFQTGKLSCTYKSINSSQVYYLDIKINTPYVGANIEKITLYSGEDLNDNSAVKHYYEEYPQAQEDFVNFDNQLFDEEKWEYIKYTPYGYISKYREKLSNEPQSLCPKQIFIINTNNKYGFYACGNEVENNSVSTCSATENYVKKLSDTVIKMDYVTSVGITVDNMFDGGNTSNIQDIYNEVQEDIEKYCDDNLETYNKELCEQAKKNYETTIEQGQDVGKTEEELEAGYSYFKNNLQFGNLDDCASYLGYIYNPNDPAYYLNLAFNIIKYISIIMLFVFSISDYIKAIVSNKDDGIKKATQNTIKRLIIAIIIFFLPILINFIFDVLGIITTDATCDIGTNIL